MHFKTFNFTPFPFSPHTLPTTTTTTTHDPHLPTCPPAHPPSDSPLHESHQCVCPSLYQTPPLTQTPPPVSLSLLEQPDVSQNFTHILRLLNTNIAGRDNIVTALTQVKGVGRRYANVVCKKADVDLHKRAGQLNSDELERIVNILQNPMQFKIPVWFLNRQKDITTGKHGHLLANQIDSVLRDDLERLKKIVRFFSFGLFIHSHER